MSLEIINCEQGTPEWLQARCGVPTASCFSQILAKGKGLTRKTYMMKLAGERITDRPADVYTNAHMERGTEQEPIARSIYVERTFNDALGCGFMKQYGVGYSPDGLINDDGLVEFKSKMPHLQAEVLLDDVVPSEHIAQIQGGLYVSDRKWCDFVSFCPGMPIFIKRVERDESYIASLKEHLATFETELREVVARIEALK